MRIRNGFVSNSSSSSFIIHSPEGAIYTFDVGTGGEGGTSSDEEYTLMTAISIASGFEWGQNVHTNLHINTPKLIEMWKKHKKRILKYAYIDNGGYGYEV